MDEGFFRPYDNFFCRNTVVFQEKLAKYDGKNNRSDGVF